MAENFRVTFRRLKRTERFFYFIFIFLAFLALFLASYRQHMLFYLPFTISGVYLVLMYRFSGFRNHIREPYWIHVFTLLLNICIFVMSFEHYLEGCAMMSSLVGFVVILTLFKMASDDGSFFRGDEQRAYNGSAYAQRP